MLDLLVAGHRTNEIAAHLFVSPKIVGTALTAIYAKLAVADRTEAILLARARGVSNR